MIPPTISPAAPPPGSQLAAGAYPGTRRLSFQIAEEFPFGNTAAPELNSSPARALHTFRSSKRQPTHNIRGCCSERDKTIPVRVGNDADLRAGRAHQLSWKRPVLRFLVAPAPCLVGHLFHSPSSPPNP